jgi:predicted alpha/beta-hydrolase family hydrolase
MRHAFLETLAGGLADRGIATFRYQFPYVEAGRRRPDREPVLLATVRAAVAAAKERAGDLPIFAGGKSMGGRMTSRTAARDPLGVVGLVFLGFPLHPPGKPSTEPMLFLQGDRDTFAKLELLEPIVTRLGARATLHLVGGADHGFHVLKRSGRTDREVLEELVEQADAWTADVLAASPESGRRR